MREQIYKQKINIKKEDGVDGNFKKNRRKRDRNDRSQ